MKRIALLFGLVGCIEFHAANAPVATPPRHAYRAQQGEDMAAMKARIRRDHDARNDAIQERVAAARALRMAETERNEAEAKRAAKEKKDADELAKVTALETACAADRDGRRTRLDAHLKSYDDRNKLLDWEDKHCKIVDHGKSVVREYELPNGAIVKRRIISGYPVRECDAKEPAGLPRYVVGNGYRSRGLVELSPSDSRLDDECAELDKAAGWDHIDYEAMGEEEPAKKK